MKLLHKTTEEVRQTFLEYFLKRDHQFIEPSGIIPKNDPTLMFINSGMAPLKPYFTGQAKPPYPRLTNVQTASGSWTLKALAIPIMERTSA
ncbi:MAG: Alanine--tRNA ligase [Syntrophomonadaceae bacterium]|nr:Alanine--tRNA ligase [Bacillota bacterium]